MNAKVLSLIYGYWLFDGVHTSKGKSGREWFNVGCEGEGLSVHTRSRAFQHKLIEVGRLVSFKRWDFSFILEELG